MIYRVTATPSAVIAESDAERLTFPFHWQRGSRAYTYASISEPMPARNGEQMDLATFTRWMGLLEQLGDADNAEMEIDVE